MAAEGGGAGGEAAIDVIDLLNWTPTLASRLLLSGRGIAQCAIFRNLLLYDHYFASVLAHEHGSNYNQTLDDQLGVLIYTEKIKSVVQYRDN